MSGRLNVLVLVCVQELVLGNVNVSGTNFGCHPEDGHVRPYACVLGVETWTLYESVNETHHLLGTETESDGGFGGVVNVNVSDLLDHAEVNENVTLVQVDVVRLVHEMSDGGNEEERNVCHGPPCVVHGHGKREVACVHDHVLRYGRDPLPLCLQPSLAPLVSLTYPLPFSSAFHVPFSPAPIFPSAPGNAPFPLLAFVPSLHVRRSCVVSPLPAFQD